VKPSPPTLSTDPFTFFIGSLPREVALAFVDRVEVGTVFQLSFMPATATGTCSACCLEQGRCIFYKLFIPTGYFGSLDLAFLGRPFGAVILGKGFWL